MVKLCVSDAKQWNGGSVDANTVLNCRLRHPDEFSRPKISVGSGRLGHVFRSSALDMNVNDPFSYFHLRISTFLETTMGALGTDPNDQAAALHAAAEEGASVADTDWQERLDKEFRSYDMWRHKVSLGIIPKKESNINTGKRTMFERSCSVLSKVSLGSSSKELIPLDPPGQQTTDFSSAHRRALDFIRKSQNGWADLDGCAHIPRFPLMSFVSLVMKESDTHSHLRQAKVTWDMEALLLLSDLLHSHLFELLKGGNYVACSIRNSACVLEDDVKHSLRFDEL